MHFTTPLPQFPHRRELLLEDKPFFDELLRELQPRISELTFAGLYLFRGAHSYRISYLTDSVIVSGTGYDGTPYLLPPLGGDRVGNARQLLADGWEIYGANDELAAALTLNREVTAEEERDNFDYLYVRSDLVELPGNRYHKKKNRVAYFTKRHEFAVELYESAHRDGCLALLQQWRQVHHRMGNGSLTPEIAATAEALEMTEELGLEGVVILVGGEVRAFALGERLNNSTAVCHFEKGDPFLDGVYQLVNREFCRCLFTECEFVNREQDLGEPNLRQAKLSYHPVELIKKYRLRLQKFQGEVN
jgi:uncharacterized protein